jgi:hypothetical protein
VKKEGWTVSRVRPLQIHCHYLCNQFQIPGPSKAGIARRLEHELATVTDLVDSLCPDYFAELHHGGRTLGRRNLYNLSRLTLMYLRLTAKAPKVGGLMLRQKRGLGVDWNSQSLKLFHAFCVARIVC